MNKVKMYQDLTTLAWKVDKADGTSLSIAGSLTNGLQEAINEAVTNGFDLDVQGLGISGGVAKSIIGCQAPVFVPPAHMRTINIHGLTIAFASSVLGDGFVFDSCMQVNFNADCEIAYAGNGCAVAFQPRNSLLPLDPDTSVKDCRFFFKTILIYGGPNNNACVRAFTMNGGVCHNYFEFLELRSGGFGFQVCENATPTVGFFGNIVKSPHIHAQTQMGVQIGNMNNSNISGNTYELVLAPANGCLGVESRDKGSVFNLSVLQVEGTPSVGFRFPVGGNNNLMLRGLIVGAQQIYGSGNRIV